MATKKTARKSAPKAAKTTPATRKKTTRKTSTGRAPAGRARGGKTARSQSSGGNSLYEPVRVEREIAGRTFSLESGRMARQADGAIIARYGDTMVLATAQSAKARGDIDFLPLTVDYREKAAAAGKFPGGFFKREGRPTSREILTCRIIDRSIRPLFPDSYRMEVQLLSQVLSTDQENESDIVGAVASFAALAISTIPNGETLGACRIGCKDGKLIVNPTWSEIQSPENTLNLTVAAHKDAVAMVEAGGNEITEDVMLEALELAHDVCTEIADMIDELVAKVGKPKQEVQPAERRSDIDKAVRKKFAKLLHAAPCTEGDKAARKAAMKAAEAEVLEALAPPASASPEEAAAHQKYVKMVCGELFKEGERAAILAGTRSDGRDTSTIRPIEIEVGVLPRVHGSVLFTRGETQSLSVATLGTASDSQFMDGIYPEESRRFLLHYNFPPFSVGEVKRFGFVGRREIGHGALAERAIAPILPSEDEFPYTLRVTSEILESNGSSSMATVCGATLALMDAGVPIKQPVAGIAMGLVIEGKKTAILTDILGSEDHCGDMDFKVAGTGRGITALQMDIKCEGLSRKLLEQALDQAREARLDILRTMLNEIRAPREELSPNAPRLESIQVPVEKIGLIIGPGGRNIRQMQTDYAVRITVEDDGRVQIAGVEGAKVLAAVKHLEDMTAEVEPGTVYTGRVTSIKEFGAFIEILPGQEGLCHVSELSNEFIRAVTDVVRIGDEVKVKVIGIDDFGKIKLSKRAIDDPEGTQQSGERRPPREDRGGRGDRDRGDRGDRDRGDRGRGRDDAEGRGPRPPRDRDVAEERPRRGGERDGGRPRGRDVEEPRREPRERGGFARDDDRGRGRDEPRGGGRDRDEPRGRGRDRDEPRGGGRDRDEPRGGGRDRDEPRGRGRDRDEPRGGGRDRDEPRGRGRGRDEPRTENRDEPRGRGRGRDDTRDRDEPRGRGGRTRDDEASRPSRGRPDEPVDDVDEVVDRPEIRIEEVGFDDSAGEEVVGASRTRRPRRGGSPGRGGPRGGSDRGGPDRGGPDRGPDDRGGRRPRRRRD